MPQGRSTLIQVARFAGTTAGYMQRSAHGDFIEDAKRLLMRSPERSMMAAAAIGLVLGTVLGRL